MSTRVITRTIHRTATNERYVSLTAENGDKLVIRLVNEKKEKSKE